MFERGWPAMLGTNQGVCVSVLSVVLIYQLPVSVGSQQARITALARHCPGLMADERGNCDVKETYLIWHILTILYYKVVN